VPLARLNGVLLSHKLSDFLRQDLVLTTMSNIEPFYNFNLAYIADVSIGKVFDVGAGISFDNMISTDERNDIKTSVRDFFNNGYLKALSDTGYYTLQGTKLMFRFMFDPKRFFEFPFLGEKDGVIYAEAAILGLKDYPRSNAIDTTLHTNDYGYDNIFEKMPVMFGCNIPAFKLLDVLSVEGEWFGSKYPDSYANYLAAQSATPSKPGTNEAPYDYEHDDWKWAVYAKKTIWGGFSLIGIVGRDHLRTETFLKQFQDYEATLIKNNHWYWMFKVKYDF
jgi:hypothetical protein